MDEGQRRDRPLALAVIYFGVAFTLVAFASMVLLTVFRPSMGELSPVGRWLAMLAPVLLGLPFGLRVAWVGRRDALGLGAALKRGIGLG